MVFVYGFCNGNDVAAVREYGRRFPNRRLPDSRVFDRVFTRLSETGAVPSSHFASERANEQNVNEVEDILHTVERSPSTSTRRIATRLSVPQTRI